MLLTRANPEAAEKLRRLIAGETRPKKRQQQLESSKRAANKLERLMAEADPQHRTPRVRPVKREPKLVSQYVAQLRGGGWLVQLPMYLDSQRHGFSTARWAKAAKANKQICSVLLALRTMLRTVTEDASARDAIRGVTLVRISPSQLDDDNLASVFKHVRDAVFAWIVCGNAPVNMRAIGHYDATVKTGKHYVTCEQTKCEANPRAHGFQILLHV